MNRQHKLLEVVWKPKVKPQRISVSPEPPQQHVIKEEEEEEVLTEQQLCNQERNSSLDQEEPESLQIKEEEEEICTSQEQEQLELKQEADNFMLTPDNEESDHMEPEPDTDHQLLSAVAESQKQTGIKHVEITIVESKEEKDRQHRLMKILWKPRAKLQQKGAKKHGKLWNAKWLYITPRFGTGTTSRNYTCSSITVQTGVQR
ncbi:histone H3.v1-like isoform X2 [Solea solea]|uniref:histone H3.v1-like isoform X2 n=1 Tax=Solea solea TaxID=90069 RepID=UPI00272DA9F8|nr:histone H3.v1-like isoform X2 [Solea solea]XP_058469223.1 histone H3.v1-like isoform X2 [Solea solea]